jgi:putative transposase
METKVTRHRHTGSEIVAKLATADDMAARGVLHRDIAKSLGISVMTYHRWRKARDGFAGSTLQLAADGQRIEIPNGRETTGRIRELRLENSRLRRLVADLLLEKIELQESRQGIFANHRMVERS